MIILFTWVIFPDYLIPKVISFYLCIAFREKLMITVANMIILVIIRSLATPYAGPHKLFKSLLYLYCRREKTIKGGNFLWRMKLKKLFSGFAISHAFFFGFLSHVYLRPFTGFSFILHPKAELMDETAIDDYSSVRICLNANIPTCTFLFINRWC